MGTKVEQALEHYKNGEYEKAIEWLKDAGIISKCYNLSLIESPFDGNKVDNQVPSKIFDYISLGKPIINVYTSEKDPALEYLKQYPLALNISETNKKYLF